VNCKLINKVETYHAHLRVRAGTSARFISEIRVYLRNPLLKEAAQIQNFAFVFTVLHHVP